MSQRLLIFLLLNTWLFSSCKDASAPSATGSSSYVSSTKKAVADSVVGFTLTPETAHPKAKLLLHEDFYWSEIDGMAPFGSDDGSDAFYEFRDWRLKHPYHSPVTYYKILTGRWGYESDQAIIAIGFGQFVLEGKIDEDIQLLTKQALERSMEPGLLDLFDEEGARLKTDRYSRMLVVLKNMNSR